MYLGTLSPNQTSQEKAYWSIQEGERKWKEVQRADQEVHRADQGAAEGKCWY